MKRYTYGMAFLVKFGRFLTGRGHLHQMKGVVNKAADTVDAVHLTPQAHHSPPTLSNAANVSAERETTVFRDALETRKTSYRERLEGRKISYREGLESKKVSYKARLAAERVEREGAAL